MKTIIQLIITVVLMHTVLFAQDDTLHIEQKEIIEVFDVVAIYKSTTDGRGRTRNYVSELKGEILNYDQSTGVLTFKDQNGKIYALNSEQYEYFEYNKQFERKVKKFELRPRKQSEIEISAGFRASFINFNDNLSVDDYYLSSQGGTTDLPISIYLGIGKYLKREHYVGLNGELALTSYGRNYFSAGLRYCYQYDNNQRNISLYLPVELNYFRSNYEQGFQVNDSIFNSSGGGTSYSYPGNQNIAYSLSALSLSFGQGFGFIMSNKRSLAVELSLVKYFPFTTRFTNIEQTAPNVRFSGSGFRMSLIYNI